MKHAIFSWTIKILRAALIACFLFILLLFLGQRFVYFRPTKMPDVPPAERISARFFPRGMPVTDVDFHSADGTRLNGMLLLSGDFVDENTITVLFCHGNGGWLASEAPWVFFNYRPGPAAYAFFLFDYRAYGYSAGSWWSLTEATFYADARAARKWLAEHVKKPETEVVLMGHSLGGAVAVELAQDGTPALVLCATFDSLPDVAAAHFPLLPVRMLVRDRFDSAAKIGSVSAPLLMFHGKNDRTVPISCGEKLFAAANEPKRFIPLDCEHDDIPRGNVFREIMQFLKMMR